MSETTPPDNINPHLWDFPCTIAFKAMAVNRVDIDIDIVTKVQEVVPGDYSPNIKPSAKGNYVSISIHVHLETAQQVEALYRAVRAIPDVKMCL
ncbi:MAG: DUF493 family protein [Gammaproteobacteria bacterium]|nr:DUF493 family protein [Gammaproteobacteria bacterium]NVK88546.1 DUF493 family protein [Gammaproteobacteria bacterium]